MCAEHSEIDPCRELEHARIKRAGDGSERRAARYAIRLSERRSIRDVKRLGAELKVRALRDREFLSQHHVRCLVARASNGIARAVPYRELRSDGERVRVEPSRCAAQ